MRKMRFVLPVIILGLVLTAGCAKPPQADVDAAKAAVESARAAGASDYAQASLKEAEDGVTALDAELAAQQKKFALFRSYKNATTMAATAKASGEKAVADAAAGKEKARGEAEAAITGAKAMLEEAKGMLATAPAGKGSQTDIEAMKNDLTGVETSVAEADKAYQEGRFLESKSAADAANQRAGSVKAAVQQAQEMRKAAKGKRM